VKAQIAGSEAVEILRGLAPWLIVLTVLVGFAGFTLFMLGAVGPRYRQIDRLSAVASVTSWQGADLILEDGRRLSLPGIKRITGSERALRHLVERGVEVKPNGRVAVLVRIYSGCGNCNSYKERRWKYDLSILLAYLGLAERDENIRVEESELGEGELGARYSKSLENEERPYGGSVRELERLHELNGVPLDAHAEPELVGLW